MKVDTRTEKREIIRKTIRVIEEETITLSPDDVREAIEQYLKREFPEKNLTNFSTQFLHEIVKSSEKELDESDWEGYGEPGGSFQEYSSEFYGAKVLTSYTIKSEVEVVE